MSYFCQVHGSCVFVSILISMHSTLYGNNDVLGKFHILSEQQTLYALM